MSIAFGLVFFGALLIIAGWQNVSVSALARGDNTVAKPASSAGASSTAATATPSTAPAASGNNHP